MSTSHVSVPRGLRTWFLVHFWVDMVVAVPLFVAPVWTTQSLGFVGVDPLFARLVAAALLGIGGVSAMARDKTVDVYRVLLALKLIWSSTAIIALVIALFVHPPSVGLYLALGLFTLFFFVWRHYTFSR